MDDIVLSLEITPAHLRAAQKGWQFSGAHKQTVSRLLLISNCLIVVSFLSWFLGATLFGSGYIAKHSFLTFMFYLSCCQTFPFIFIIAKCIKQPVIYIADKKHKKIAWLKYTVLITYLNFLIVLFLGFFLSEYTFVISIAYLAITCLLLLVMIIKYALTKPVSALKMD